MRARQRILEHGIFHVVALYVCCNKRRPSSCDMPGQARTKGPGRAATMPWAHSQHDAGRATKRSWRAIEHACERQKNYVTTELSCSQEKKKKKNLTPRNRGITIHVWDLL